MDGFPPNGDTGFAIDRQPAVKAVVQALRHLADEIDAERQRADRAEASLGRVTEAFDEFRQRSDAAMEMLVREIRGYVCATAGGQRALLEVTRQLLGSGSREIDRDHVSDGDPMGDSDVFGRFLTSSSGLTAVQEAADGSATHAVTEGDETTDEHRIIDLQNEIDMRRLNATSYVQSLIARF